MSLQAALLPLFVQVLLTFVLWLWMGYRRGMDFRTGAVRPSQIALREPTWPARTMQISNSFSNQFELPMLFYVLTILVLIARKADLLFVILAWVFVLSRIAHAAIHVTTNNVHQRGAVYGIGALVLLVMWVIFIVRVLIAD
jgi:hypothetical protein